MFVHFPGNAYNFSFYCNASNNITNMSYHKKVFLGLTADYLTDHRNSGSKNRSRDGVVFSQRGPDTLSLSRPRLDKSLDDISPLKPP